MGSDVGYAGGGLALIIKKPQLIALRSPEVQHSVEFRASRVRVPQDSRSGLSVIMGKWPGDETDEEIEEILKLMS